MHRAGSDLSSELAVPDTREEDVPQSTLSMYKVKECIKVG